MSGRWSRWVDLVPLLVGAWCAFQVLDTMSARLAHPFDLEWMEGGMLAHALRLSEGRPIYTEPGPEWIPYIYPPGFAALVAGVGKLAGGVDYLPARLLSGTGTLAASGALVRLGAMRGSIASGLVGAVAFLLTYRASGAFFDLARPDGIAIGLLSWTLLLAIDRAPGTKVAAGLLLAAAFVVKHHSAAFGFPIALALWLREGWRPALRFGLSALLPALLFVVLMQWRTEGRFLVYLIEVPRAHPMDWERLLPGMPYELGLWMLPSTWSCTAWLLGRLPAARVGVPRALLTVACLAVGGLFAIGVDQMPVPDGIGQSSPWITASAAAALGAAAATLVVHLVVPPSAADRAYWFVALVGATGLAVVSVMRAHNGGFMNVVMPAHWMLAGGTVLAVADLRRAWPGVGTDVAGAAWLAAPIAWGWSGLELEPILPNPDDYQAAQVIVAGLRECPEGPIFSPYSPWLVHRAGREPGLHLIALWDVAQKDNPMRRGADRVVKAAKDREWSCVLAANGQRVGFGIEGAYVPRAGWKAPSRGLSGRTGWRARPAIVLDPAPTEAR
ncbi:MAG: hypothetical protein H6735_09955 [Alphaproteobacteria bacterium]|nr:hypothetical protein [Alphaproteobacteria bacterium]